MDSNSALIVVAAITATPGLIGAAVAAWAAIKAGKAEKQSAANGVVLEVVQKQTNHMQTVMQALSHNVGAEAGQHAERDNPTMPGTPSPASVLVPE